MSQVVELETRTIGRNIQRELNLRRWNVLELRRQISAEIGQTTLYRIVNGEVMPTLPILAVVAKALDTTIDALISDSD